MTDCGAAVIDNEPLNPDDVAAFLDGKLEGDELTRVEAHLAYNPLARQELIKASRIISSAPKREVKRPFRFAPLIGLAAAAAIAVVMIRPGDTARESSAVATERRGAGDEPDRVEIVSPGDDQTIVGSKQPFAWHPVDGSTYRVVIQDISGNTVFQTTLSDTSLALPASVRAAGTYYLSVDALAPDGTSITSGPHQFLLNKK